jgi:hypothetical protein
MASLIYNSFLDDVYKGNIVPQTDTFKVMLVTSAYTENKDSHTKRSDITNEVIGTGYTAGGAVVTVTIVKDTALDRNNIVFDTVTWSSSTITARKAVYYKSRGGLATADEVVAVADFGTDQISSNGNFTLSTATISTQN